MKGVGYYIVIFMEEFNSRMTYHTSKFITSEDEQKLVRDVVRCTPASDYLDSDTLNEMRKAFAKGFGDRDVQEFARAARLSAKMGNKWCVDILILSIHYAREKGPSLIYDATFQSLM